MENETPFSPADLADLAQVFVRELESRSAVPLGNLTRFTGAGVYAVYYTGAFPHYATISARNANGLFVQPIYVGKAIPPGSRKGQRAAETAGVRPDPTSLYTRLTQHANSIRQVETLDLADFSCRYRLIEADWITVAELLLIRHYQPIWNWVVDGFGLHDPGKGRYEGQRSKWDTIHRGRSWEGKLSQRNPMSETEILARIEQASREEVRAMLTEYEEMVEANTDEET